MGLLAVVLFSNGLPLWQVLTSWAAIGYRRTEPDGRFLGRCRHSYWVCSGIPLWAPIEFVTGFSYLLLFGAGFYLGPIMICLAALTRLQELRRRGLPKPPPQLYELTIKKITPDPKEAAPAETDALLWDDVSMRPGLYVSA